MAHIGTDNPVQAHSAGELFPYVIAVQERQGYDRAYLVIGPGTTGIYPWPTWDAAVEEAKRRKAKHHLLRQNRTYEVVRWLSDENRFAVIEERPFK